MYYLLPCAMLFGVVVESFSLSETLFGVVIEFTWTRKMQDFTKNIKIFIDYST